MFATAARAMQVGNIAFFGGGATCTLIRRVLLQKNGTGAVLLEVDGNQLAGAATLALRLAGLRVGGTVPAGATFTLAGSATVYTVSTAAEVVTAGALVLAVSPVLSVNQADGVDLSWVQPNGQWSPRYSRRRRDVGEAIDSAAAAVSEVVNLEPLDGMPEPRVGDLIEFSSTNRKAVLDVGPVDPGGGAGRYVVTLGEVR